MEFAPRRYDLLHTGNTLVQWGPLQFTVAELNTHEYDLLTAAQFAKKEIAGARPPREYVGEDDAELYMRGRVFPLRLGGLDELGVMEEMREKALPHPMIDGTGDRIGGGDKDDAWFVLERLIRGHKHLTIDGIGQVVEFEAIFVRVPIPRDAGSYVGDLLRMVT